MTQNETKISPAGLFMERQHHVSEEFSGKRENRIVFSEIHCILLRFHRWDSMADLRIFPLESGSARAPE